MFDKDLFAKRIKYFRKQQGYTLLEFSEIADISVSYLTDIETGQSVPSVDVIVSLLNALKIDYDTIMNENKEYEQVLNKNIVNSCNQLTNKEISLFKDILEKLER